MGTFLTRPQNVHLRRVLFQVHLWTGIAVCLWVVLVCTTGSALVFRADMQQAMFPRLFTAVPGAPADAATILERVRDAYPGDRIYSLEAPTRERPTAVAYVAPPGQGSRVVLIDPATASILGQLPEHSLLSTIGDLHANLLTGRPGRLVNGIGSLLLLVLCATGLVIWWPGMTSWRRGFTVDFRRNWRRVVWDLHGAVGIWTVAFIAMWAATGVYFAAAAPFRSILNVISPLASTAVPTSKPADANDNRPSWRELIVRAQDRLPDHYIHRVIPPWNTNDPFVVMFSKTRPAPAGPERLTSVYFDQFTGEMLSEPRASIGSAGDLIVEWIRPLHYGTFGGASVRIIWLILGLAPAVMAVTGFVMWWSRVVRPRRSRA